MSNLTGPEDIDLKKENGEPKKIAGIPESELKAALIKLYRKSDDWRELSVHQIRRDMEKKFDLNSGKLKLKAFDMLIEEVVDENVHDKSQDVKSNRSKRSDRHRRKSKRYSSSESSSPERRSKRKKRSHKDDPAVKRIESLKKVIRGCGVPITGFHRDESYEQVIRKLEKIIDEHKHEGMKVRMSRPEMLKVRSTVQANRELEELKHIPKKLQFDKPTIRKVARKQVNYNFAFPKTGVAEVDKESSVSSSDREDTSNYSD